MLFWLGGSDPHWFQNVLWWSLIILSQCGSNTPHPHPTPPVSTIGFTKIFWKFFQMVICCFLPGYRALHRVWRVLWLLEKFICLSNLWKRCSFSAHILETKHFLKIQSNDSNRLASDTRGFWHDFKGSWGYAEIDFGSDICIKNIAFQPCNLESMYLQMFYLEWVQMLSLSLVIIWQLSIDSCNMSLHNILQQCTNSGSLVMQWQWMMSGQWASQLPDCWMQHDTRQWCSAWTTSAGSTIDLVFTNRQCHCPSSCHNMVNAQPIICTGFTLISL